MMKTFTNKIKYCYDRISADVSTRGFVEHCRNCFAMSRQEAAAFRTKELTILCQELIFTYDLTSKRFKSTKYLLVSEDFWISSKVTYNN